MAEPAGAPPRRSALGALPAPHRPAGAGPPGVDLQERQRLLIRQIAAWCDAEVRPLRTALAERLGVTLPEGPDATGDDRRAAVRIAPRRWWLVEDQEHAAEPASLAAALTGRAALTDLSHARSVLRLAGPAHRRVLAKLCRIDLHPRALPSGRIAQTALGQVPVLIHVLAGEPGVDLYLPRSLAVSGAASLIDAAVEFGIAIDG